MAARSPRPEDLYDLRVPTDVALSPDARWVVFSVKAVGPGKDGYRTALWIAPADGGAPARQLTAGAKNDTSPRWSPDGRTLAFLSDRSSVLQAGGGGKAGKAEAPAEGGTQVWLLPFADGGEARQLTDLPKDVEGLSWSPDGRRLCVVSGSASSEPEQKPDRRPEDPPVPDTRLIDTLLYQFNGTGFIHDRFSRLWLVDAATGSAELLTRGDHHDQDPQWSPDGRTIAFVSDRHPNADLGWRSDIHLVTLSTKAVRQLSSGRGRQAWMAPTWSPDGEAVAAIGTRDWKKGVLGQASVWLFRVRDGRDENLLEGSDLEASAGVNSDLVGGGAARLHFAADGRWLVFTAPAEGSQEVWRVELDGGRVERLTRDRHYLGRTSVAATARGGTRLAAVRTSGTEVPDVVVGDIPTGRLSGSDNVALRRVTDLMRDAWGAIRIIPPVERWHEVDGRRVQGWFVAAPGSTKRSPAPLVVEIHGGPATLYGWSLMWEWQVLAAAGISVYACNPRGSQGYGQAFLTANVADWGDGPMSDVIAGLDALIADGLVDGDRMGVTGGSYGGYLTSWIVGHTDRFKAAVTCRSVNDMVSQMLSGDIGGPTFGLYEYGVHPWEDWDLYRRHSPLTYAPNVTTPLLIQHSEKDLRCTITQAEELFAVLRSLRKTVRLMRVPEESHELTRSGTPFRRVDNLRLIAEWFRHFLIEGKTRLPRVDPNRG